MRRQLKQNLSKAARSWQPTVQTTQNLWPRGFLKVGWHLHAQLRADYAAGLARQAAEARQQMIHASMLMTNRVTIQIIVMLMTNRATIQIIVMLARTALIVETAADGGGCFRHPQLLVQIQRRKGRERQKSRFGIRPRLSERSVVAKRPANHQGAAVESC